MQNFMNDFQIFFTSILSMLQTLWNWFISTTIGEITLGIILIGVFMLLLNLFVNFKD